MNYNIWLLFEDFRSLTIGGKIVIVAAHILVVLLLILLEEFRTQRHDAKKSSTTTLNSLIKPVKKPVHTIYTSCERDKPHNCPNRGILNTFRNNLIQPHLYCKCSTNRDSPSHPFRYSCSSIIRWARATFRIPISHIKNIVAKLRKLVNQSGEEPVKVSKGGT